MVFIKNIVKSIIHLYTSKSFLSNRNTLSVSEVETIFKNNRKKFSINKIKEINSFQQQLFLVNASKGEKNKNFYLKCYHSHASWWTANSVNLFSRELTSIDILKKSNFKVPKLISTGTKKNVPWLLMRGISGSDLKNNNLEVNPEDLAVLVSKMHASQTANPESLICFDAEYVENEFLKMTRFCDIDTVYAKELVNIIKKFSQTSDLVFSHGDLHLGNLILKPNNKFAIIDFEETVKSYRQFDVAELGRSLTEHYGQHYSNRFIKAYFNILGHEFNPGFQRDVDDFVLIRNHITGIFLKRGGYLNKFPQYHGFINDEKTARINLTNILEQRLEYLNNN